MDRLQRLRRMIIAISLIVVIYVVGIISFFMLMIIGIIDFEFEPGYLVYLALFPGTFGSIIAALSATLEKENEKAAQQARNLDAKPNNEENHINAIGGNL